MIQHEKNEHVNFINRYLHSRRYEYLKSFLQMKYRKKRIKVLEIGVGHGRLFAELNAILDIDFTGIEFVQEFFITAKEKYADCSNFKLIQGSILDKELQDKLDESYDVIVALETFEHIHTRNIASVFDLFRNKITCTYFITSVPVEVGFTIFVKNFGSFLMHYRRYKEYTIKDTIISMFYQVQKLKPHSGTNDYPGHKGFDWRCYRYLLHQDFEIRKIIHLPLIWLPSFLSTNVMFISAPRKKLY